MAKCNDEQIKCDPFLPFRVVEGIQGVCRVLYALPDPLEFGAFCPINLTSSTIF